MGRESTFIHIKHFYYMCVCSVMSDSLRLQDCSMPGSSVHGFFWQESWSELPFLSPGDLPNSGVEPESPMSLHWQVDSLPLNHQGSPKQL